MPALRLLFIILVILNLLALAANLGWLGSSQPRGEPERITNQLNPERIVLQSQLDRAAREDSALPADAPAAPVSAEVAPPAPEQAEAASASTEAASAAPATTEPAAAIASAAPAPDAAAQSCIAYAGLSETQAQTFEQTALATAGVQRATQEPDPQPAGWWVRIPPASSREAAERRVAELRAQGITDYFIIQEAGPNQFAVSLGVFRSERAARQHLAVLQQKRVRGAQVAPRSGINLRVEIRGSSAALRALAERLPAARQGECTP